MLFSERYKDNIEYGHGQPVDHISDDVTYEVKHKLIDAMLDFAEPQIYHPNRYSNYELTTDAITLAIEAFNEKMGAEIKKDNYDSLTSLFTPHLFDIIELQYIELSDNEKAEFQQAIDKVFISNDMPWILHDGRMVKIDSSQFEMDLKNKALSLMKELKDAEPVFQSAYTELTTAVEMLEKGDYQSAINNAGKSYESILKVILEVDRGNADKLTTQYMERFLSVPETMTKEGFRAKVMMALPFVRNNSGADHGAGAKRVVISKPMAKLAINLACSLNAYLIEEYTATQIKDK